MRWDGLRAIGLGLLTYQLRRVYREVVWVGPPPILPRDRPVILYANHHVFFDGQLLTVLCHRLLRRPTLVWMADADRFPVFRVVGALPFPLDPTPEAGARRIGTIRRTVRRLSTAPETVLLYFPEGRLHSSEDGIDISSPERFAGLDRLLPRKVWWPVAVHVSGHQRDRPTAYLTGGIPHDRSTGQEAQRLERLLASVRDAVVGEEALRTAVVAGARGPHERFTLSALAPLFRRFP